MKLQNILFPSLDTCTEERMYFRREKGVSTSLSDSRLKLKKGETVDFDTYFNGFSAEKWYKYTCVNDIFLTLKIKGNVRVTLMRREKIGSDILTEYTGEYLCEAEELQEFTFPFKTSSINGMYCFRLTAVKGKPEFYGGYYSSDVPADKLNDIKIAIGICTYRREKFVEANLALLNGRFLQNPDSELYQRLQVFISDNAKTLDTDKLSSEKIHIFPNKNTGGAGGFTRGLMEIKRMGGFSHALLMDDDIVIEPESIFRTYVMLTCAKEQYREAFVGGAMLRLDRRNMQVESGAMWAGGNIISLKHGLDLNVLDACLYNEFEENAQYNAWWYCTIPMNLVADDNLPVPIFIRGDDVEYGLRNIRHLILINGICVWHEPFENKYSSFLFYYILRNRLIDNSIHRMAAPKEQLIELLEAQVMEQVRLYRYKNARLLMRGIEDFLKGIDWLMAQNGEELHKSVMSEGYRLQPVDDLEERVTFNWDMYMDSVHAQNPTTFKYRLLNKLTVNGIFHLPTQGARPYNVVPTEGAKFINVYRTDKVLNYDYASRKGFLTYKNPQEAKETMKQLKRLTGLINRDYDNAVRSYGDNFRKLTSMDFWSRYLEIEK